MTNPAFNNFLDLPDTERHAVIQVTRQKLDMPLVLIEKDLWTCHVLDALFNTAGIAVTGMQAGYRGKVSACRDTTTMLPQWRQVPLRKMQSIIRRCSTMS